jgi:hypothetical protein
VAEAAGLPNLIRIESSKRRFVFSVEGTGAIKPMKILRSALTILKLKLDKLSKEIEEQSRKDAK